MDGKLVDELEAGKDAAAGEQAGKDAPRKPGTFRPGDPRINRDRGPRAKAGKGSSLLRDMRRVYGNAPEKDRTEGERNCREWLKTDRKGFMAKLADLEKADASAKAAAKGAQAQPPAGETDTTVPAAEPAPPALIECPACGLEIDPSEEPLPPDPGSERALGLIERLLALKPWQKEGLRQPSSG